MVSWNLGPSTADGSWLSEATVLISNSAGAGVALSPAFGDNLSGTANYTGSINLVSLGMPFSVLPDGKLFLHFYETFDDVVGGADAVYTQGNITFAVYAVPELETVSLMHLGMLAVAGASHRRRRK